MPDATILVIDDNPAVATALSVLFSLHDFDTIHADSPEAGLALLERRDVDLVIQDMNFSEDTTSGEEGEVLFATIRERFPDLPVILLTAWTQLSSAVDLVKAGASDYIGKPWDDRKLLASVANLIELGRSRQALRARDDADRRSQQSLRERFDLCGMVFADPATERVLSLACQVARADVPVLVTGPNGSGKECIAAIIQANSAVKDGPFVTVNCGALPSELIEAELFGAEAGAYTGASKARQGKFEAADGGTLFLDEIGNLPPAGQMKLLRVLETGRFSRLGSNTEKQVKVRVISATNADLSTMIRDGGFREDLFYRLNVIEVELSPLAKRPADILPLARHFLGDQHELDGDAESALKHYRWPGNVRELKNVMQRAKLLATQRVVTANDLGLPAQSITAAASVNADDDPDAQDIRAALDRAGGVIAQAAAELGLSRQALYRRMDRLGIERP